MRMLFTLCFGFLVVQGALAATYTAATCNESDVQTAIGMATNGDTVNIPACAQTNWTTTLNVNVGITLAGAGQGNTTIGDNVPKGTAAGNCTDGYPLMQWTVNSPNSKIGRAHV